MHQNRSSIPKKRRLKQLPIILVVLLIVVSAVTYFNLNKSSDQSTNPKSHRSEPTFDKTKYPLDDPTSPWVVVNKKRQLKPIDFAPPSLVSPNMRLYSPATDASMKLNQDTSLALEEMNQAALAADVKLMVISGFRSYQTQKYTYESEVKAYGQKQADRESARPGHSEHQTGWAVDLGAADGECRIQACFADTPEGEWLEDNAYKFGFILRYAPDKEQITGYMFEPWHIRFVGKELAAEMHRVNTLTLEEFFNLPAAPSY